eukprot:jgi/Psemu1/15204/gm1.15204_g
MTMTVSDDHCFSPNDEDDKEGIDIELPPSLSADREGNNNSVIGSPSDLSTSIMTPNAGRHVSDKLKAKIKLIKIMWNHSISLVTEKELYEWAFKSERLNLFSWMKDNLIQRRSRVMKEIYATVTEIEGDGFEPHLVDWCYKKSISLHLLLTNVTLVKEDNLSFPHAEDPTLPVQFLELQGNSDIDKLHHGECGQTTLTPLNMTLGIFNTLTWNSRPNAWETIYFHPTCSCDKGDKSIENVNNLHSGLRDIPQHDQLCGHYQTTNTKMICGHCNCPRALGNNARVNVLKVPVSIKSGNMQVSKHQHGEEYRSVWLWKMSNFTAPMMDKGVNVEQYFKNVSHHRVHNSNSFYDLDFGENPHNIYLASPS